MTRGPDLMEVVADRLADSETTWSVGTFGAIAGFSRDAGEAATLAREPRVASVVTARGGIRLAISEAVRPIASESLTAQNWNQRVALCLPQDACAMGGRSALSEIGPDRHALRAQDRAAILFDLGLGALQLDACIRTDDQVLLAVLRRFAGESLFAPGNGAMGAILAASPHRVFLSRVGRIEVFQPIPAPDGKSPDGPHTHILPRLLRHKLTHAATEALPAGWIPCAHFYLPHPMRDAFGRGCAFRSERHEAFQGLLARYGDPQLVDLKQWVIHAVEAGEGPPAGVLAGDRFSRATVRIALRQLQACGRGSPALAAWLCAYDQGHAEEPNDAVGEHPCTA